MLNISKKVRVAVLAVVVILALCPMAQAAGEVGFLRDIEAIAMEAAYQDWELGGACELQVIPGHCLRKRGFDTMTTMIRTINRNGGQHAMNEAMLHFCACYLSAYKTLSER